MAVRPSATAAKELNGHFSGQSSFARKVIVDERSLILPGRTVTEADLPELAPLGAACRPALARS
jgi:hypothetical protein